jgi:hypothetical protein
VKLRHCQAFDFLAAFLNIWCMTFRHTPSTPIVSFAIILCSLFSQTALGAARAKYAGEFIAIGVGGRALGLGGAYSALAHDVTAGYWNPAGLSAMMYPQITLMHDERFGGLINYDYAAFALPAGTSTSLAISLIRLGVDDIPNTQNAGIDANGNPLPPGQSQNLAGIDPSRVTYFNAADWAFYFSYAKSVSEQFSYGANIKLIRRELGTASATGIGFDLGAQYLVTDRFLVGANAQDVTTTLVAWNTGTNELITPTLKTGTAYLIDLFGGRLTPAFDIDFRFEGRKTASNAHLGNVSMDFHSGVEFDFKNLVAVRAGYSDIGSLNVGTGIHLPKFDIDYSFAKFDQTDQLDNTHRISLTFTLEAEQFRRSTESR